MIIGRPSDRQGAGRRWGPGAQPPREVDDHGYQLTGLPGGNALSSMSSTVVYTDGACSGNPGPGGWAWAVSDGPFASGPDPHTTNQRMEITAALEAVRTLT